MPGSFGLIGYLVLAVYIVATLGLGLSFALKQKNLAGYFLAERAAPWWAVGNSLLACDLSAISYIGTPGWTYHNDLRYPMSTFMMPIMAGIVAYLFVPFLARIQAFTIYEYLERRFDLKSRLFASAIFSSQRASHMSVAIYAISLALNQIVGWPVWGCIIIIGGLTTFYTVFGGMKAVLWTDVMQFFVLVGGIFAMTGVVLWHFNGDVLHIWNVAAEAGHTKLFSFDANILNPSFWKEMTVWGIFLGLLVSQVGAYGSDQVLVQRYIAAGSARSMTKSLIFCSLIQIPVSLLLFFLGFAFFAFYHAPENATLLSSLDQLVTSSGGDVQNLVMPHFIRNVLPSSLAGLVLASLFAATMSVFSSGLNSLSTVTCVDFIQRLRESRPASGELSLTTARWVTFVWGVLVTLSAVAVYLAQMGSIVEVAAAVIGFFSGPLLGMFLLGMFTLLANSTGAILGAIAGFLVAFLLRNHVSFIWYAVTGCVPTIIVGYLISYAASPEPIQKVYSMTIWGRSKN